MSKLDPIFSDGTRLAHPPLSAAVQHDTDEEKRWLQVLEVASLPTGYRLFRVGRAGASTKGQRGSEKHNPNKGTNETNNSKKNSNVEYRMYGHPSGGWFRTPAEFIPHLSYLAGGAQEHVTLWMNNTGEQYEIPIESSPSDGVENTLPQDGEQLTERQVTIANDIDYMAVARAPTLPEFIFMKIDDLHKEIDSLNERLMESYGYVEPKKSKGKAVAKRRELDEIDEQAYREVFDAPLIIPASQDDDDYYPGGSQKMKKNVKGTKGRGGRKKNQVNTDDGASSSTTTTTTATGGPDMNHDTSIDSTVDQNIPVKPKKRGRIRKINPETGLEEPANKVDPTKRVKRKCTRRAKPVKDTVITKEGVDTTDVTSCQTADMVSDTASFTTTTTTTGGPGTFPESTEGNEHMKDVEGATLVVEDSQNTSKEDVNSTTTDPSKEQPLSLTPKMGDGETEDHKDPSLKASSSSSSLSNLKNKQFSNYILAKEKQKQENMKEKLLSQSSSTVTATNDSTAAAQSAGFESIIDTLASTMDIDEDEDLDPTPTATTQKTPSITRTVDVLDLSDIIDVNAEPMVTTDSMPSTVESNTLKVPVSEEKPLNKVEASPDPAKKTAKVSSNSPQHKSNPSQERKKSQTFLDNFFGFASSALSKPQKLTINKAIVNDNSEPTFVSSQDSDIHHPIPKAAE